MTRSIQIRLASGPAANRRAAPLSCALHRFRRDEGGSMIILGLIFFVLILMVSGLAVDLIRQEHRRVQLQSLADRAVLAAASLTQPQDIEDVVRDYFEREGMLRYLVSVEAEPPSLNAREVTVVTRASVTTLFASLVGLNRLESTVVSRAEERVADVEVTMVLDLSNSMNAFNRIENLRIAGEEFIDTLYENAQEDRISVSVVPYTGQVNAGHALLDHYTTTYRQSHSACVNFDSADYGRLTLSTSAELTGSGHFDPWHMSRFDLMAFCPTHPGGIRGSMSAGAFNNYVASQGLTAADFEPLGVDTAEIMVFEDDPDVLRRRLRSLIADGNTSIEIGMKWAAALMDSGSGTIVNEMIEDDLVNAAFSNRPFEYGNPDAIKTIVLMTDGENWDEWRLADAYKEGPSGVWLSFPRPANAATVVSQLVAAGASGAQWRFPGAPSAGPVGSRISVANPSPSWGQGSFRIPSRNQTNPTSGDWANAPDRFDSSCTEYGPAQHPSRRTAFRFFLCNNWVIAELDHRELWATFPVRWVGAYLYHYQNVANYWTWVDARLSTIAPHAKNQRLYQICDLLRDQNVRVYAVAFEAPPNGVEAMRRCAFTENHFFDVNGLQIQQAFRTIAGSIQRLRLTQ